MPDQKAPNLMTQQELSKRIKDLFQLKRALYDNIFKCKETLTIADSPNANAIFFKIKKIVYI